MVLKNFILNEVVIGKDANVNKLFNIALRQAYSQQYVSKIEKAVHNQIPIKEVDYNDKNIIAWNQGTTIYINKPIFYNNSPDRQIQTLLHEFSHVLSKHSNFIISKTFPEYIELSHKLYNIVNKNLTKDISEFLTSSKRKLPPVDSQEIIAYMMNFKTDWSAITPEGRKLFIKEFTNSGIFNMDSNFWKKRFRG